MELGTQIRKYRSEQSLSQEELAERVFVSRQSVSNWENGKTYPDLKSLLLLSDVFGVSLDQLVKGDIERMKQEIDGQELAKFQRDSRVFSWLFLAMLVTPVPLCKWLGWAGAAAWLLIVGAGFYYAERVEKHKKKYNIQTYREIVAFMDGKPMDEMETAREQGKRPYQKAFLVIASGIIGAAVTILMFWLFK